MIATMLPTSHYLYFRMFIAERIVFLRASIELINPGLLTGPDRRSDVVDCDAIGHDPSAHVSPDGNWDERIYINNKRIMTPPATSFADTFMF